MKFSFTLMAGANNVRIITTKMNNYYSFFCLLPYERTLTKTDLNFIEKSSELNESHNVLFAEYHGDQPKLRNVDEIAESLGFIYTRRLSFFHESDLRNIQLSVFDSHDSEIEEFHEFINEAKVHDSISVRHIPQVDGIDIGFGIFAESYIGPNEFVGEYVGMVSRTCDRKSSDSLSYSLRYPTCDDGFEVDAREYGNITRFLNHSSCPNVVFRKTKINGVPHVFCASIASIQKGTQLTVDYGASYWKVQGVDPVAI